MIEKVLYFLHTELQRTDHTLMSVLEFSHGNGRLAMDRDQVVGVIFWGPSDFDRLTICEVGVALSHRRQGIATALLNQALTFLHDPEIYLHVDQTNAGAIKLYQSFGFYSIAELGNYYGPGKPAFYMKRVT